jgi:hypothetical protein
MADKRDIPKDDGDWSNSEFGLGEGLLDPVRRADRNLSAVEFGWEIAALPKTFDGSMPDRPSVEETPVPRLLPGEKETDR